MWKPLPESMFEYGPTLISSLGSGIDLEDVDGCGERLGRIKDLVGKYLSESFFALPYGGGYTDYWGSLSLGKLICYKIKDGWAADLEKLYRRLSPPWQPDPVAEAEFPMFKTYTPVGSGMYLDVLVKPRMGRTEVRPEELRQAKNELGRAELNFVQTEKDLLSLERRRYSEVAMLANQAVEIMMNRPKRRGFLRGPDPVKMGIYKKVKAIAANNPYVSPLRSDSDIHRQHLANFVFQTNVDKVSEVLGGGLSRLRGEMEIVKTEFMERKDRVRELEARVRELDGRKQKVNLLEMKVRAAINPEYEIRLVDSGGRTRESSRARTLPQPKPGLTIKSSRKFLSSNNLSEQDRTAVLNNLDLLIEQMK